VINDHQGIPPRARYAGLVGMMGRTPLSAGQTRKTRRTPSPEALKRSKNREFSLSASQKHSNFRKNTYFFLPLKTRPESPEMRIKIQIKEIS
jgi:hypothetical protein